ncbi:MAG: TonB-dependent receptor [Bacteroidetes bacterium]|nr:TonB-dependent receptor [Bacteroidota bacterium]
MVELRNTTQIANAVSSQQMSKTQDRSAADVMRRIPGVTLQQDRFIMIRGLAERYNTILLNNGIAPSAEADRKAFSLDMIPTRLLDRIIIMKTAMPELSAEFAGGMIKIYTRNTSDDKLFQVIYSTGFRQGTTFQKFNKPYAPGSDLFTLSGKFRNLPGIFPSKLSNEQTEQQVRLGQELPNTWVNNETSAMPDQQIGLMYAGNTKLRNSTLSNLFSIVYNYDSRNINRSIYNYNLYDFKNNKSDTVYHFDDIESIVRVNISALNNTSLIVNSRNKIELKNLVNRSGTNSGVTREGKNFESGNEELNYASRYIERTLLSSQLGGEHERGSHEQLKLDWTIAHNYTLTNEPDYRRLRTVRNLGADANTPYMLVVPPSASLEDLGRFYSTLNEQLLSGAANAEYMPTKNDSNNGKWKIKTGIYTEYRNRDYKARWLSYKKSNIDLFDNQLLYAPLETVFNQENINSTTGFKIEEGTNPTDKYNAGTQLLAWYVQSEYQFGRFTISGGARVEALNQTLSMLDYGRNPITVDNKSIQILPSVIATYPVSEKAFIKAAYAHTVNRPEFREMAAFSYYDFVYNESLTGNPQIKNCNISNFDVRYDFYPSGKELITFGLFYKKFINPIEKYALTGSGGGTRNFSFGNADYASTYGVEAEIKKSLAPLNLGKFINNLSISINSSYIYSRVSLGSKATNQVATRPLMGQSPYIINGGFFYDNDKSGIQASVLYNLIGPRIFAVGADGNPDIYEMPRHVIDASLTKEISKHWDIKIGIRDALNAAFIFMQDANLDNKINAQDETIMRYQVGSAVSLGINYKL